MKTHTKKRITLFACLICAGTFAQTLPDAIHKTQNEQYAKAKVEFQQLVSKEPTNGDNFFYFGDLMLKTGDLDSAKILFQKGVDINPMNPLTHVGMARYMMATGNVAGAEKEITYAKSLVQTQAGKKDMNMDAKRQAVIDLAIAETEIMTSNANFDDAIAMTNQAEKLDGKNPDVFLIRGDVLYKKDPVNGTPAITCYIQASRLDPHSCMANVRIGSLYANGKNMQSAIGYFNVALKTDSTFAPAWRMKGESEYQLGKFDSAAFCSANYLRLNDDPDARYRQTIFLYEKGAYDDAITQGNIALSKDSNNIVIYRILGRCYYDKKVADPSMAIASFNKFFAKQKVLGKPPVLADDYVYRGRAFSKNNQDSLALLDYNTAMKMDTSRHDIYFEVATSYYKMKKYDMAAMYYKKKIDLDPAHANISDWNAYGRAMMIQKDYATADSAFKKVTQLDPKNPIGWLYRGKTNALLDPEFKSDSARAFYEHYFDLASVDKDKNKRDLIGAATYLAGYHYIKKNYACSKAYFQYALDLDPTNADIKKQLDTDKSLKAATAADIGTCKMATVK